MKSARVEIIGNHGKYTQCPFTGEFKIASTTEILAYMRQLAIIEGLKSYIVFINDEMVFKTHD